MSELLTLAERCEKATGPDRELDAEIMFDLYAVPVGRKDDGGPAGYLWPDDNPSWNFGIRFPGKDRAWFKECRKKIDGETLVIERDGALVLMNSLRIPALTKSIDSALTLVPKGFASAVGTMAFEGSASKPWGCFWEPNGKPHTFEAATPALALCAAALRARSIGAVGGSREP